MATITDAVESKLKRQVIDRAVVRFCGDSGDGMQISGSQFTNTVALYGNDLATFPDFPAEIRAPAGTLPGVSGFQVNFSSTEIYTPGDAVDVLVAMNPAALKMNVGDLKPGGILIVNVDNFKDTDLKKPQCATNPLDDHSLDPYTYRNISGNSALALGFIAAAQKANLPLFQGSYPIAPASDILHELSMYKEFGVMTFQAEDEIAAITSVIGAAYGGSLAITTTSGPGMALKTEAMGLAVAVEIPLVICDIQRGGPSTGLPTKTEQADLLQALFGRNSEAPIPVLAASTPADCFWVAIEASRIAVKYMVPVIILSDGYLANGAEPWRIPELSEIPDFPVKFASDPKGFLPYQRDPRTLARPWAVPGTPGLEHRIGGLEQQDPTGNINYEPLNHENMVRVRAAKVAAVAQDIPNVLA